MRKNLTKQKNYQLEVEKMGYFMRLGDILIKARKSRGLTQQELAKELKTSQRIISAIENADNYNMGVEMLYRILLFFNLPMIVNNIDVISGHECFIMEINNRSAKTFSKKYVQQIVSDQYKVMIIN
jgi:transcriptional regulator with XRE-family HTH domain